VHGPDLSSNLRRIAWLIRARNVEIELRHLAKVVKNFNPSQPRVPAGNSDGGQWTDAGGGDGSANSATEDDPSRYHIVQLRAADSGVINVGDTPVPGISIDRFDKTDDPVIDTMTEILLNRVAAAHVRAGEGVGPLYGTTIHTEFGNDLRAQQILGLEVEQSFSAGDVQKYGVDGSIRTDVILRDANAKVIAIWDLKTGAARLEPKRAREIRKEVNVGPEVPVIELHIQRGVTNKRQPLDEPFIASVELSRFLRT
jgi:hypothetical protein